MITQEQYDEVRNDMETLYKSYISLVDKYKQSVEDNHNLVAFLTMQCGILYTAITGQVTQDPLQPISLLVDTSETKDLKFMRDGFMTLLDALQNGDTVAQAIIVWQKNYLQ